MSMYLRVSISTIICPCTDHSHYYSSRCILFLSHLSITPSQNIILPIFSHHHHLVLTTTTTAIEHSVMFLYIYINHPITEHHSPSILFLTDLSSCPLIDHYHYTRLVYCWNVSITPLSCITEYTTISSIPPYSHTITTTCPCITSTR